jgi:lysophospholipid acyltransferase (LPLAT)-like uncharacterized protein
VPEQPSDERHFSFLERLKFSLLSLLAAALIRVIGSTLRTSVSFEDGAIQSFDEGHPGIFPFWHRCVLPATWIFREHRPAVMTSQSRDGEYIARVIRRFGFVPVRGSSSRGGDRALIEMNKLLAKGEPVAFTIDGPRGPRYVAKRGPVLLARMSGIFICAFYVAVERAWVLHTWDALMIPKPFSRVHVRFGRKIFVPADADSAAMEGYHAEMQAALERVTAFGEGQFGKQS